jgi:hypothetical protein
MFGILASGHPPSWIRYSLFTLLSRVPNIFICREGARGGASAAEYTVGTRLVFRLTITPNVLWSFEQTTSISQTELNCTLYSFKVQNLFFNNNNCNDDHKRDSFWFHQWIPLTLHSRSDCLNPLSHLHSLTELDFPSCLQDNSLTRTTSKTSFFYCCAHLRYRGNMFTKPIHRNGLRNPVVLLLQRLPSNGRCF